ncbi:hypothetical protein PIB30_053814 [Stylosanthes scabra]|uniref:Uncharacterized protein n=1 Tax=Stylosanthes scabra TaxID=79078 RepID=A0ABU6QJD5_9FABA|nr:hypothetical protein [Stylosanthes scabra]
MSTMRRKMVLLELTAFAILPIMLAVVGAVFVEEEIGGEEKALGEREFFMRNLGRRQRWKLKPPLLLSPSRFVTHLSVCIVGKEKGHKRKKKKQMRPLKRC